MKNATIMKGKVVWLTDGMAQAMRDAGHTVFPCTGRDRNSQFGLWREIVSDGFGEINALIDAIGVQADRMKARIAELEAENNALRAHQEASQT